MNKTKGEEMKQLKKVKMYVELLSGWQDQPSPDAYATAPPFAPYICEESEIYSFEIDLPCVGGSALAEPLTDVVGKLTKEQK